MNPKKEITVLQQVAGDIADMFGFDKWGKWAFMKLICLLVWFGMLGACIENFFNKD